MKNPGTRREVPIPKAPLRSQSNWLEQLPAEPKAQHAPMNHVELEIALARAQQDRDAERARALRFALELEAERARLDELTGMLERSNEAQRRGQLECAGCKRWSARVMLLEARADAAVRVLQGRISLASEPGTGSVEGGG